MHGDPNRWSSSRKQWEKALEVVVRDGRERGLWFRLHDSDLWSIMRSCAHELVIVVQKHLYSKCLRGLVRAVLVCWTVAEEPKG